MKNEEFVCPKCGEWTGECIDYDFDAESLAITHTCHKCDAVWTEYYALRYTGYAHEGIDYDEEGKEMQW